MTLIDIIKPWMLSRWSVDISKSPALDEWIVGTGTGWLARIYSDKVVVRDSASYDKCICCAKRTTLHASDPEFFSQLENAIWHCMNDETR